VGWEGIWGATVISLFLVIFYFIPGSSAGNHFENAPDAFVQLHNSVPLALFMTASICSIAFFNFFGKNNT
jgi:hypothetical protein